MRKLPFLLGAALVLSLAGCSSQTASAPAVKKEVEKPVPVTGQSALFRMYQVARTWAPDAAVLKMTSMHLAEVPDQPGNAGAWEASFTSTQRIAARSYTWSAIDEQPNLHKGVFAGSEQSFSGSHGPTKSFLIAAVKIDSDAAVATAKAKAVDYEKKNPGKPITLLLEQPNKYVNPTWRVIWGESLGTSNFSIYVDATTGSYLETMH